MEALPRPAAGEDLRRKEDPRQLELRGERRTDTLRPERTKNALIGVETLVLELEQVLRCNDRTFHSGDLRDVTNLSGPVGEPRDLDDDMDGGGNLLPYD